MSCSGIFSRAASLSSHHTGVLWTQGDATRYERVSIACTRRVVDLHHSPALPSPSRSSSSTLSRSSPISTSTAASPTLFAMFPVVLQGAGPPPLDFVCSSPPRAKTQQYPPQMTSGKSHIHAQCCLRADIVLSSLFFRRVCDVESIRRKVRTFLRPMVWSLTTV